MVRALGAQVGRLPQALRQVAALTREGLENDEIARELGITEATVRSHYDDAEAKLKTWLDATGAVDATYLRKHPALVKEAHRHPQEELLTAFLTSLSQECWRAFFLVHLEGKRVSEARKILGESRAATEALLAYAYWAMWRKSGFLFPRDFIRTILPPHPRYRDHVARFTYW
jgi:DNA-directed RNA polymerase specialized sigma24 family protein